MKTLLVITAFTFSLMGCGDGNTDMNRTPNDGFGGTPPSDTANRNTTNSTLDRDTMMMDTTRTDNTGQGPTNQ